MMKKLTVLNLGMLAAGMLITIAMWVQLLDFSLKEIWLYYLLIVAMACVPFVLVAAFVIWWQNKANVADILTFLSLLLLLGSIAIAVGNNGTFAFMGLWALPVIESLLVALLLIYAAFARRKSS